MTSFALFDPIIFPTWVVLRIFRYTKLTSVAKKCRIVFSMKLKIKTERQNKRRKRTGEEREREKRKMFLFDQRNPIQWTICSILMQMAFRQMCSFITTQSKTISKEGKVLSSWVSLLFLPTIRSLRKNFVFILRKIHISNVLFIRFNCLNIKNVFHFVFPHHKHLHTHTRAGVKTPADQQRQ